MCMGGLSNHCRDRTVLGIQRHDGAFAERLRPELAIPPKSPGDDRRRHALRPDRVARLHHRPAKPARLRRATLAGRLRLSDARGHGRSRDYRSSRSHESPCF
ncbi:MAG: hypothetical protein ACTHLN_14600 [Tepidisphaeraceae bacterium]